MSITYIEGNIGAGKSSLLKEFATRGYSVESESVDDKGGLFQRALQSGGIFELQVAASLDLHRRTSNAVPGGIMERGQIGAKAFIRAAAALQSMTPLQQDLCTAMNSTASMHSNLENIIYLDADPDLCLERIRGRDRHGEEGISIEYLNMIDACYRTELRRHHENVVSVFVVKVQRGWSVSRTADTVLALIRSMSTVA